MGWTSPPGELLTCLDIRAFSASNTGPSPLGPEQHYSPFMRPASPGRDAVAAATALSQGRCVETGQGDYGKERPLPLPYDAARSDPNRVPNAS